MDINMIQRSFKCYGISNNINGSEDTLIFDFDKANGGNTQGKIVHNSEGKESEESEESGEEKNIDLLISFHLFFIKKPGKGCNNTNLKNRVENPECCKVSLVTTYNYF